MNSRNSDIQTRLDNLAYKRTEKFCYSCHQVVKASHCPSCGSDDCIRILAGEGVEYGVSWVIPIILRAALTPVDVDDAFEQSVRDGFSETTKAAWAEFDTVEMLKTLDPVGWRCALADHESYEVSEDNWMTFDGGTTHYYASDIESFLDEEEKEGVV